MNTSTRYTRQVNEVEALKAIYGDAFKPLDVIWKTAEPPPHFAVVICHGNISFWLEFTLSSSYPDFPPTIGLKNKKSLTTVLANDILKFTEDACKSRLGTEMIYEVVELVKERLQDPQHERSFYDQMIQRQNEEKADRERDKMREENRLVSQLQSKIKKELEVKTGLSKTSPLPTISEKPDTPKAVPKEVALVTFEPPILHATESATHKIICLYPLCTTGAIGHALVRDQDGCEYSLQVFDLSCNDSEGYFDSPKGQKRISNCIRQINEASQLPSHPSVVNVIGCQVVQTSLYVLSEPFHGILLDSLLSQVGRIEPEKAFIILLQILQGLQHIHRSNFVHKFLSTVSIIVGFGEAAQPLSCRIIGVHSAFELELMHSLQNGKHLEVFHDWEPPEGRSQSRKFDIWSVGILALQILLGKDVNGPYKNSLIRDYPFMADFCEAAFCQDPAERSSVGNLVQLVTSLTSDTILSKQLTNVKFKDNLQYHYPHRNHPISTNNSLFSRYATDFEELELLGQGGFGQVLKVRNRIDGRLYAIKRLFLDSEDVDYNRKILREVLALSRLQHDRIVRYYQAWIESPGKNAPQNTKEVTKISFDAKIDQSDSEDTSFEIDFGGGQVDWMESGATLSRSTPTFPKISSSTPASSNTDDSTGSQLVDSEILYIQMEFCPNKTLRDAIDQGNIDMEAAWRFLRQIVEGLVYIHSQGVIHRDLKPGNVFLDSQDNVKLGDFGLAATLTHTLSVNTNLSSSAPTDLRRDMTCGIGTPLYVPPEQADMKSQSYNDRADMFSLGIIVVELFSKPFPTEMERITCLRKAREGVLDVPLDEKVSIILKCLLVKDTSQRISASELLKGEYMPARVEDEYVKEAIRSIANSSSPHYQTLIDALFKQTNPLKDFTYDTRQTMVHPYAFCDLREALKKVFDLRSIIEFYPSRFRVSSEASKGVRMLDAWGQVVELNEDLCRPFARHAARNYSLDETSPDANIFVPTRRWAMDRIFKPGLPASQPKQLWEVDYDVIFPKRTDCHLVGFHETLEVIQVAIEILHNSLGVELNRIHLFLGHTQITKTIRKVLQVNDDLLNLFQQNLATAKRKYIVEQSSSKYIDPLLKLITAQGFEEVGRKLVEISRNVLGEVSQYIVRIYEALLKQCKVAYHFDPFLSHSQYAHEAEGDELRFMLAVSTQNTFDPVALGGRYDSLISSFQYPHGRSRVSLGGIGVAFSAAKLFALLPKKSNQVNVIVSQDLADAYSLACELWEAGIPCSLGHDEISEGLLVTEIILDERKYKSQGLCRVSRHHSSEKRQQKSIQTDVINKNELIPFLQQSLNSMSQTSEDPYSSVNLNFSYPKNLTANKNVMRERATRIILPLLTHLGSSQHKRPLEVITHELSLNGIGQLLTGGTGSGSDRDEIHRIRELIRQQNVAKGTPIVNILYSLRDNRVDFMTN